MATTDITLEEALKLVADSTPEALARRLVEDSRRIGDLEAGLESAEQMRTRFEGEVGAHFDGITALINGIDGLKAQALALIKP